MKACVFGKKRGFFSKMDGVFENPGLLKKDGVLKTLVFNKRTGFLKMDSLYCPVGVFYKRTERFL